jgi:hypothetical protein
VWAWELIGLELMMACTWIAEVREGGRCRAETSWDSPRGSGGGSSDGEVRVVIVCGLEGLVIYLYWKLLNALEFIKGRARKIIGKD